MSEKSTNVDQIRELIFGDQMADYDANMEKLQSQIDNLRNDIQDFFNGLKTSLDEMKAERVSSVSALKNDLKETEQQFNSRLQQTESNLKEMIDQIRESGTDRLSLAEALVTLGNRLKDDASGSS